MGVVKSLFVSRKGLRHRDALTSEEKKLIAKRQQLLANGKGDLIPACPYLMLDVWQRMIMDAVMKKIANSTESELSDAYHVVFEDERVDHYEGMDGHFRAIGGADPKGHKTIRPVTVQDADGSSLHCLEITGWFNNVTIVELPHWYTKSL